MLKLLKALSLSISETEHPVVTLYELSVLAARILVTGKYKGKRVDVGDVQFPDERFIRERICDPLEDFGVLHSWEGFHEGYVYRIAGRRRVSHEDVICCVDPFCYLSHLSAMEYHGITDRILRGALYISSPSQAKWRQMARTRMQKDCDGFYDAYKKQRLQILKYPEFVAIDKRNIKRYTSSYLGAFKNIEDRPLRMATMGRTFLDMVREPGMCGGINHVMDVFEEFGRDYFSLAFDEIDAHGRGIEKVRAGYLFEEKCGVTDKRLEKWLECVQRGGSRKLDPDSEYSSDYSEKWCLSLNNV